MPVSDGVTVTLELEDCVGLLDCEDVRVDDGVAERVGLGDCDCVGEYVAEGVSDWLRVDEELGDDD